MKNITKNLIDLVSDENSNWKEKAEFRRANRKWLDRAAVIALKILNHLKEKGISQKQFAEIVNVTPQYINRIVKGSENLSLETISKIEDALGITLIEVVGIENTKSYEMHEDFGNIKTMKVVSSGITYQSLESDFSSNYQLNKSCA